MVAKVLQASKLLSEWVELATFTLDLILAVQERNTPVFGGAYINDNIYLIPNLVQVMKLP